MFVAPARSPRRERGVRERAADGQALPRSEFWRHKLRARNISARARNPSAAGPAHAATLRRRAGNFPAGRPSARLRATWRSARTRAAEGRSRQRRENADLFFLHSSGSLNSAEGDGGQRRDVLFGILARGCQRGKGGSRPLRLAGGGLAAPLRTPAFSFRGAGFRCDLSSSPCLGGYAMRLAPVEFFDLNPL